MLKSHQPRVNWEESNAKTNETQDVNGNRLNNPLNFGDIMSKNGNGTLANFDDNNDEETNEKREYILITYCVIMAVGTFFYLYRSFSFFKLCLRISINMHDMLFRGITRAKMIFFNNNPSGRILNRFARDIGSIDSALPVVLLDVIDVSFIFPSFCFSPHTKLMPIIIQIR